MRPNGIVISEEADLRVETTSLLARDIIVIHTAIHDTALCVACWEKFTFDATRDAPNEALDFASTHPHECSVRLETP